jgi:hypothetical protein
VLVVPLFSLVMSCSTHRSISPGVYVSAGDANSSTVVLDADGSGEFRVPYRGRVDVTPISWTLINGTLEYRLSPSNAPPTTREQKVRNITEHSFEVWSQTEQDVNLEPVWGWVKWMRQQNSPQSPK